MAKPLKETVVNQAEAPLMKYGFHSLGRRELKKGTKGSVIILGKGSNGNVHADAVQVLKMK